MNWRRRIYALALLCALMAAICAVAVQADFGDFSGASDYGSGYGGSSDSSGYGADGHDDGRSSGDYSFDGFGIYSSGGESVEDLGQSLRELNDTYFQLDSGGRVLFFVIIAFILAVVVGLPVFLIRRIMKKINNHGVKPVPAGAERTAGLQPIDALMKADPNFSAEVMKERLAELYVRMQNAWTAKDITPLRDCFTDAQFAQYSRQLQKYRDDRQTSYIEQIVVLGIDLKGVRQDGAHDMLVAELRARIVTYTLDDVTGNVIRGSRDEVKFMEYEWMLVRPRGKRTPATDGGAAFSCPKCGASMEINRSATCAYCGSVVSRADYDWVISGIKGLSQQTMRR